MITIKLKALMDKHELSQRELSRKTGIRQTTIGDYYNNKCKHISINNLDVLCDYFNCNVEDLITFSSNKKEG